MSNVVKMFEEGMELDIGVVVILNPPVFIPISDRAKKLMKLDDNVQGVVYPHMDPKDVLELFGDQWVVGILEEQGLNYELENIHIMTIKKLH